jgi:secreted trypsin-like serine protease
LELAEIAKPAKETLMNKLASTSIVHVLLLGAVAVATACAAPVVTEEKRATGSKIIAGTADNGDPAVVAVVGLKGNMMSTCTGEVITPTFVLTASHCVDPRALGFVPDKIVIATAPDLNKATSSDVLQIRRATHHPGFNPNTGDNDIAVIELAQPTSIAPIPFNHGTMDGIEGKKGRAIGYGRTVDGDANSANTKNQASLTISDINAQTFLATSLPSTQCHGDSGGPVLFPINGVETIVGIGWHTVLDDGSCVQGVRDLRVDPYVGWIQVMTRSFGGNDAPAPQAPQPQQQAPQPDPQPDPQPQQQAAPGQTVCCFNGDRYDCPNLAACTGGFDFRACMNTCTDVDCMLACEDQTPRSGPTAACTKVGPCN